MQGIIHIGRKKRKPKASKRPQDGNGSQGTRGKSGVRIDDISLNTLVGDDIPDRKDRRTNIRGYPVAVSLSRPAVDKETDRGGHGGDTEQRRAELRLPGVIIANLQTTVNTIIQRGTDLRAEPEPQTQGDIVQPPNTGGFIVIGLPRPEERERRKHEVHDTVGVGHVERESLHDRLGGEQPKGTDESGAKDLRESLILSFFFGLERLVAGLLAQFLGPRVEDLGAVCLA